MTGRPHPPRLARAIAALLLRGDAGEVIAGDLDEDFASAVGNGASPAAARRRYWRQTIASIAAVRRDARETRAMRPAPRARF